MFHKRHVRRVTRSGVVSVNIYQRINEVMKEVEYVQKDAVVQGYKAVTHDQVVSVVRALMVKHGIVIYPYQRNGEIAIKRGEDGGKQHLYTGTYAINFVNIDDPKDRIIVQVDAHAADSSDKAPGKAVTYATKAAILKVLCLETGESDESRAEATKTITDDQAAELKKALQETESDVAKFCKAFGISCVDDMHHSNYAKAMELINKKREAN